MSKFGQGVESGEGVSNKLYTGVENFTVTAVCPSIEELKKIYGENAKEDTYVSTTEDGKQQIKVVMYLDNQAEEGEPSIKTRLTFFVVNDNKTSTTNKKLYINLFGETAWLPEGGAIPDNMKWYNAEGMRLAYNGEDLVISFLRNLLNLPSADKAEKPEDAASQFDLSDWTAMFAGNFATLKSAIMSSPNKIGLLLGVKTTDEGKQYQDVFNRNTLRQWSKASGKFDYLRKNLISAQNAGSFSKTDFGNQDFILREYVVGTNSPSNDSAFGQGSFLSEESKESFV